jgi:uncharacterized protein YjiS (DUF1127 family)
MSLGQTIALAAAPILAVAKVSSGIIIAKSVALGALAAGAIAIIRSRREFGRLAQMDAAQLRDIGLTPADIYDARMLALSNDQTLALARLIDERRPRDRHSSTSGE